MITKFLAVTVQFTDLEDDHVIVSSFEDAGKYIKEFYSDQRVTCVLLEPVDYYCFK